MGAAGELAIEMQKRGARGRGASGSASRSKGLNPERPLQTARHEARLAVPAPLDGMPVTFIAEELAKKQKEISVAEFFERNKQLLGFDSPTKAFVTAVKEAVDNALDACEEASILPEVSVKIEDFDKAKNRYKMIVEDNGPGIVPKQVPPIFAKLLYGSRFHAIRQSRGQQGIGISAVVMYGQLTTGRPALVRSKIGPDQAAWEFELRIDLKKNAPEVLREEPVSWPEKAHGTRVEVVFDGRYIKGKQSAYDYLRLTAVVNPHAQFTFVEPDGTKTVFERVTDKLPDPTKEIKPHPKGMQLGELMKMAKATKEPRLRGFLENEFSRVSSRVAKEVCETASMDEMARPADFDREQSERLIEAFNKVKIMAPAMDCLSPIGEILVKKGLKHASSAEFVVTATRAPTVYSGTPFQIEAGLVYGGSLNPEDQIQIMRFANRVPLLYQQGSCAITEGIEKLNWRHYKLDQRGGKGLPYGPVAVMVHVAATKVPFTSESKEAVAEVPEILEEIQLAVRDCARKMLTHIHKKGKFERMHEKETIIRKVIPMIAAKSAAIIGKPVPDIESIISRIMNTVLIEDKIDYDPKKKVHEISLVVSNYTRTRKKFRLIAVLPEGWPALAADPKPTLAEGKILSWDLKSINSSEQAVVKWQFKGLAKDDYDENDLFVFGIDPEIVSGAEKWDEDAWRTATGKLADEEKELQIKIFSADGTQLAEPPSAEDEAEEDEEEVAVEEEAEVLDDDDDAPPARKSGKARQAKIAADEW
jgi:DNA topoisomerase-6 subunit B